MGALERPAEGSKVRSPERKPRHRKGSASRRNLRLEPAPGASLTLYSSLSLFAYPLNAVVSTSTSKYVYTLFLCNRVINDARFLSFYNFMFPEVTNRLAFAFIFLF